MVVAFLFLHAFQQQFQLPEGLRSQSKTLISNLNEINFEGNERFGKFELIGNAKRFVCSSPGNNPWDLQARTKKFPLAIKKGDTVFLTYLGKAISAGGGETEASVSIHFQQPTPTYKHITGVAQRLTQSPERFNFSWTASEDFDPNSVEMTVHFAARKQALEMESLQIFNLGPGVGPDQLPTNSIKYQGQDMKAAWRKTADQMIDRNRKSNLSIHVVDGKGKPVRNATVQVRMKEHSYPFGSYTDTAPGGQGTDTDKSRQVMKEMFNRVTVPIYWADWGWESEFMQNTYLRISEWAKNSDLRMRAHCVLYPGWQFFPSRVKALEPYPDLFKKGVIEGTAARINALRQYPYESIDVVNELVTCTDVERVGGFDLIKKVHEMTAKGWPRANLVYNDFNVFEGSAFGTSESKKREAIYQKLIDQKMKIDAWGWQGHFGESLTPPEEVWKALDYFWKTYKRPIEITEFEINTKDEKGQADYTRDLLTAWFAHPATVGFTTWGFWEGNIWIPNGAMFRKNWSPKPNALVWKNLIYKQWWTNADLSSGSSGTAGVRGFRGRYEIIVQSAGKEVKKSVELGEKDTKMVVRI